LVATELAAQQALALTPANDLAALILFELQITSLINYGEIQADSQG